MLPDLDLFEPWLKGGVFLLLDIRFPTAVSRRNTHEPRYLSRGLCCATNFGRICSGGTLSRVGMLI